MMRRNVANLQSLDPLGAYKLTGPSPQYFLVIVVRGKIMRRVSCSHQQAWEFRDSRCSLKLFVCFCATHDNIQGILQTLCWGSFLAGYKDSIRCQGLSLGWLYAKQTFPAILTFWNIPWSNFERNPSCLLSCLSSCDPVYAVPLLKNGILSS